MSKHNETGLKGEQLAANFLSEKGYTILHRNWCHGKKEVDVIAVRGEILVFVEVKTRSGLSFGFPEEAVHPQKQESLKIAAEAFLESYPEYRKIQFDIISVQLHHNQVKEIIHFEDAFY